MAGNLNAGIVTAQSITDGVNSATPELMAKGTAKAWVNFNGIGTVAIRAGYNVSSITDNGVGDYTVNFITAMPDINYTIIGTGSLSNTNGTSVGGQFTEKISGLTSLLRTTSACPVHTTNLSGQALADGFSVNISVFR